MPVPVPSLARLRIEQPPMRYASDGPPQEPQLAANDGCVVCALRSPAFACHTAPNSRALNRCQHLSLQNSLTLFHTTVSRNSSASLREWHSAQVPNFTLMSSPSSGHSRHKPYRHRSDLASSTSPRMGALSSLAPPSHALAPPACLRPRRGHPGSSARAGDGGSACSCERLRLNANAEWTPTSRFASLSWMLWMAADTSIWRGPIYWLHGYPGGSVSFRCMKPRLRVEPHRRRHASPFLHAGRMQYAQCDGLHTRGRRKGQTASGRRHREQVGTEDRRPGLIPAGMGVSPRGCSLSSE